MKGKYFEVGAASIDISPAKGIELCGYAARTGGNEGIHDNLFAKAIVIDDEFNRAAIISCDLIGLDYEIVSFIRNEAKGKLGFNQNSIMISCTHTHSGPVTMRSNGIGLKDENYINFLKKSLIELLSSAQKNLTRAEAIYFSGECKVGINRRGKIQEGSIEPFPDPNGFVDKQVSIILFNKIEDKKPIAVLFNYGCHPTVLNPYNNLVSADFPGAAYKLIEDAFKDDFVSIFTNGGAGNINPIMRGSFNALKLSGEKLGNSVLEIIKTKGKKLKPAISFDSIDVKLPFEEFLSSRDYKEILDKYSILLENSVNETDKILLKANINWASKYLKKSAAGKVPEYIQINLQAINIGGIILVGIPAEVFSETSAWIKSQFSDEVIVNGYTNGNIGYLPTEEEILKGGYEVLEAHKYYDRPSHLSGKAEKNIRFASVKLISNLKN